MSVWKVWNTLLKSKTMIFSLALTTFSIIELNLHLFMSLLGEWYPAVFMLVALVTAWLRVLTTVPLEDK